MSFTDKYARKWAIDLSIGNVLRVKKDTDGRIDLFDSRSEVDGKPLLGILSHDFELLYEVVFLLCEPQAINKGVSAQVFAESLDARHLIDAQNALRREWLDFFRDLRRLGDATSVEQLGKFQAAAIEALGRMSPEIDREAELQREKIITRACSQLRNAFGELPESAG